MRPPFFSNGTEGYAWMSEWCDRCEHDHDMHQPYGEGGCELVATAMLNNHTGDEEIPDWIDLTDERGFTMPPSITCMRFTPCRGCGEGGGDPPPSKPRPECDGQLDLFDPRLEVRGGEPVDRAVQGS